MTVSYTDRVFAGPPTGVPQILGQGGVPIGIAPSGTMGANGALTSGTALAATYSGGIWLYFPAGAVSAGSAAGFYWTVMSNTTVGTVYTNTHTPGTNSSDIPGSATAVVDAGPGAYTGVTNEITAVSVTVPGGLMGKNGRLEQSIRDVRPNNANTKTIKTKLGGTVSGFSNSPASATGFLATTNLQNLGATNVQSCIAAAESGSTTTSNTQTAIDTSVNQTWTITLQMGTATDYHVLHRYSLVCYSSS